MKNPFLKDVTPEDLDLKPLFTIHNDPEGNIKNEFFCANIAEALNRSELSIDIWFCFAMKTLIHDFGYVLQAFSKEPFNMEQYEAAFLENLEKMITINTSSIEE